MTGMLQPVKAGFLGGTGIEGRGLALRLVSAGISVAIGSRQQQRAQDTATSLNAELAGRSGFRPVIYGLNGEVAAQSEFIFLTLPFAHAAETLESCRDLFQPGTVIVDVTVPLSFAGGKVQVMPLPEGSGSRHLTKLLPAGIDLAAAFKTIPAHVLADLQEKLDCDVFVCSDSAAARSRVMDLIGRLSDVRAIDAGDLDSAATLERMCALAVGLNRRYKIKTSRYRVVGL